MNRCSVYLLFIMLIFPFGRVYAGGGMIVYDPTNYLENAMSASNSVSSLFNQAAQINNQIHSIQYQVKNSGRFNGTQWRSLSGLVQKLDQTTRQGQALSYSASNLDAQFRQKYPDYTNSGYGSTRYSDSYKTWSTTTLDTLRGTLDAAGLSARNFQSEQSTLETLEEQGRSASGRMQMLQVSSEISAENVNQLQELRRVMVNQTDAQNAYMAYKVSKDSYNEKNLGEIESKTESQFPVYKNNSKFGQLKLN